MTLDILKISRGFTAAFILPVLCLATISAQADAPKGPQPLFNGKDFSGWEFVTKPVTDITTVCHYNTDGSVALAGKPVGFLSTTASYSNYRFHVEWRWPEKVGNGGVLVHISSGPKDRQWPLCFQIQTRNKAVGDLLPMAGATFAGALTTDAGAATPLRAHSAPDSEKPVGEWNSCDIVCHGDAIEVTVNDVRQNKVTGCSITEGKVGFQFEGVPYELRNVSLKPLDPKP